MVIWLNVTVEYVNYAEYVKLVNSLFFLNNINTLFTAGTINRLTRFSDRKCDIRMTMKAILADLPAKEFIRVHRSFIVPFRKIESIRNKVFTLAGVETPGGKSDEKEFISLIKNYRKSKEEERK
ncbi:MAG: LytTR family transcriptional regulator DNA-binding domain-containing protein [Bacteroidia bacterium]